MRHADCIYSFPGARLTTVQRKQGTMTHWPSPLFSSP
jgi:hypothetical protein